MRWTRDAQDLWLDPARLITAGHATKFTGTEGNDRLIGSDGRDKFDVSQGGDDVVRGRAEDDIVKFGGAFTHADFVDGGGGSDRVVIAGHYSGTIELDPNELKHIEGVRFEGGASLPYTIVADEGFSTLRIDAKQAGHLDLDASLADGMLRIAGGGNIDFIVSGLGDDVISGGPLGDILTGGGGSDKFLCGGKFESEDQFNDNGADTITDFSKDDVIFLPTRVGSPGAYHVGETPGRIGDVVATFNSQDNRTTLHIFFDGDDKPDMTIFMTGDKEQIDIVHQSHIVLLA